MNNSASIETILAEMHRDICHGTNVVDILKEKGRTVAMQTAALQPYISSVESILDMYKNKEISYTDARVRLADICQLFKKNCGDAVFWGREHTEDAETVSAFVQEYVDKLNRQMMINNKIIRSITNAEDILAELHDDMQESVAPAKTQETEPVIINLGNSVLLYIGVCD